MAGSSNAGVSQITGRAVCDKPESGAGCGGIISLRKIAQAARESDGNEGGAREQS
jgi:hypothetical protein